jgi:hypothetical protein
VRRVAGPKTARPADVGLKITEGSVAEVLARGVVIIERFLVTNWESHRWPFVLVIGLAIAVAIGSLKRR